MRRARCTGPSPEDTSVITDPRAIIFTGSATNAFVVSRYHYMRLSPLDGELFESKECILLLTAFPKTDGLGFKNECVEKTFRNDKISTL